MRNLIKRHFLAALLFSCVVPAALAGPYVQELETGAGKQYGTAINHALAFHGSAPATQRAGAAQAAVTATTITGAAGANPTQAEYAVVVARVNALTALVNELRAALVEKGLIKGAE